jgi:hypothetical protein
MSHARCAIPLLTFVLALTVAAGPALGAASRLAPSVPGLTAKQTPAVSRAAPRPAPAPASHRPTALPHTGFDVGPELLLAGLLGLFGAALRVRSHPAGLVHLEPVLPSGR